LWYGVGLGQETLFSNTKKLLPGTFLKINRNGMTQHTYWSIESVKRSRLSVTDAITETRARLEQSIQRHLRSDVPVGVFLSGGIDSSAITAFASQQMTRQLDTFAVSFDYDKGVNELEKAAFVANHFGTRHHELHVTGKDLPHIIETLIGAHDEPFADAANIPLYLLCQRVKGDVKVVLQGDGGDEIFAGYRRYNVLRYERLWRTLAWLSLPAFKCLPRHAKLDRLQRFLLTMRPSSADKRMAMLLTVDSALSMPTAILSPELQQAMASCNPFKRYAQCAERFKHEDPVQKMLFTDASILLADVFLEKVDKPTMANSIEVRVPFLDAELTELALSLPSSYKVRRGHKKWLLRQALRGLVPDQILDAPKMGFGVPIGYWLRTSLADYMKGVLLDRACPLFDRVKLEQLVQAHISGRADYAFLLWKALLLALWYQRYFADSYNSMTTGGNASYATTTAIA
jgi:asparagine synthase (glutamine-hydrolysing)